MTFGLVLNTKGVLNKEVNFTKTYRCITMHTSNTVQINRCQTLVWETVVKATAWAITTILIGVVQGYLEEKNICISSSHRKEYFLSNSTKKQLGWYMAERQNVSGLSYPNPCPSLLIPCLPWNKLLSNWKISYPKVHKFNILSGITSSSTFNKGITGFHC